MIPVDIPGYAVSGVYTLGAVDRIVPGHPDDDLLLHLGLYLRHAKLVQRLAVWSGQLAPLQVAWMLVKMLDQSPIGQLLFRFYDGH